MIESDDIVINEISLPKSKLKDLIRKIWGQTSSSDEFHKTKQLDLPLKGIEKSTGSSSKRRSSKPKQLTLPFRKGLPDAPPHIKSSSRKEHPHIQRPKILSTLFSKKFDMDSPPFYKDSDVWFKDIFVRARYGIADPNSLTYIGPDLGGEFKFDKDVVNGEHKYLSQYWIQREEKMKLWNEMLKAKLKKKYPDDYGGITE